MTRPRTRKRQRGESKKAERKRKRNSGLTYSTNKGKQIPRKVFCNSNCLCKQKCFEKIEEQSRKHSFDSFWKLSSFTSQNAYLCGLVKQEVPKYRRPRGGTRKPKTTSNVYYIHNKSGNSIKVCKKYFIETFKISDGRITRALQKLRTGKPPGSDERGRHVPQNKLGVDVMNVVREHISTYPAYQSHYTRKQNPNRKYLPSELTVSQMYKGYVEYCEGKTAAVSEAVYRRTFNTEFNLHFHAPLKDTCSKCDGYKNKIDHFAQGEEK